MDEEPVDAVAAGAEEEAAADVEADLAKIGAGGGTGDRDGLVEVSGRRAVRGDAEVDGHAGIAIDADFGGGDGGGIAGPETEAVIEKGRVAGELAGEAGFGPGGPLGVEGGGDAGGIGGGGIEADLAGGRGVDGEGEGRDEERLDHTDMMPQRGQQGWECGGRR